MLVVANSKCRSLPTASGGLSGIGQIDVMIAVRGMWGIDGRANMRV